MDSGEYYFLELNPRLQVCDICSNLNSGVIAVILVNSLYSPFGTVYWSAILQQMFDA